MPSKIPWTDETLNPWVGCTKVASGCKNCFAEKLHNMRHKAYLDGKKLPKQYAKPFSEVQLLPSRIPQPLHWKKPRKIFWCSMSDMFHPDVPFSFIDRIMAVIALTPQHTHQVLSKRPARMAEYFQGDYIRRILPIATEMPHHPMYPSGTVPSAVLKKNLWLGVSCSTQADADKNIPILLEIPATVKFVSLEPLLEPIDVSRYIDPVQCPHCHYIGTEDDFDVLGADPENVFCNRCGNEVAGTRITPLDWVIVGSESGPNRRPCKIEWVRDIVQQCKDSGTPIFVKQIEINGKVNKNMNEWPEDIRVREYPHVHREVNLDA